MRVGLAALVALAALGGALALGRVGAEGPEGLALRLSLADGADSRSGAGMTGIGAAGMTEGAAGMAEGGERGVGAVRGEIPAASAGMTVKGGAGMGGADGAAAGGAVLPGGRVAVRGVLSWRGVADGGLRAREGALEVGEGLTWEGSGGAWLGIDDQNVLGGAYEVWGKFVRFDGRTLMSRGVDKIEIVDLETHAKIGSFSFPTAAQINASRDTTDGGWAGGDYPASATATAGAAAADWGRAFDVWQEDAETAWLFVGSPNDTVGGQPKIGRLYIYKVDYSGAAPTIRLMRSIEPQAKDYLNDYSVAASATGKAEARYGAGVAVSADGTTLAVAAAQINEIGAVYVYERPGLRALTHGPGGSVVDTGGAWADWGDLTQNSGTKLTAIAIPDWDGDGDPKQTTPGAGVPDSLKHWLPSCAAMCQQVWSYAYTDFGKDTAALSADGRVVAIGAQQKQYDGKFSPGTYGGYDAKTRAWKKGYEGEFRNGEAYVFQLSGRPRWKVDTWMLAVATGSNAYRLNAQPFGSGPGVQNFGARLAVSNDGASVAAIAPGAAGGDAQIEAYTKKRPTREGKVYVFNRPGAEWPQGGLTASPGATLQAAGEVSRANGNEQFGAYAVSFRADGARLAVTQQLYGYRERGDSPGGVAWVFSGRSGAWRSADTSEARAVFAPLASRTHDFGWAAYERNGERLALGQFAPLLWVYDGELNVLPNPANGGRCATDPGADGKAATADDAVSCELALGDAALVVARDAAAGTVKVAGSVMVGERVYSDWIGVRVGGG